MTKEELKDKLISEAQVGWNRLNIIKRVCGSEFSYYDGYVDCGFIKEEQIQIDAEQIRALQKQNGELTDENERLKGDLELWESGACRATNLDKCGVVKELEQKLIEADNATDVFNAQEKRIAELTDELTLTNNECKDMREELKQRIRENQKLCEQIEKMKCCENCKNCAYAGFEIICRTYDCINQSRWEMKEK